MVHRHARAVPAFALIALWLAVGGWPGRAAGATPLVLTNRSVDLIGKVETATIRKVVQQILELDSASHDPIFLRIDSTGGSVEAGLVLVDVMASIKSPVYAVVESNAYSMAAIIALFCTKRFILPHGTVMFHEVSWGTMGEDPTIRTKVEFNARYIDNLHAEIAQRIGMPLRDYRARIRDGWWLLAEESVQAGVMDAVVRDLTFTKVVVEKTEIKRSFRRVEKRELPDVPGLAPEGAPPAAKRAPAKRAADRR